VNRAVIGSLEHLRDVHDLRQFRMAAAHAICGQIRVLPEELASAYLCGIDEKLRFGPLITVPVPECFVVPQRDRLPRM
jgi:hypothetical protein